MATTIPTSLVVLHESFARRMKQACDAKEATPALNDGRLVWIKTKMAAEGHDVSLQTVMRWYYGAAMPRQKKLISLAKILGVSPSWLALGREDRSRVDTTARRISPEGAVNALAGHMQMAGVPCAFPERGDPRAETIHFYSIIEGRQHPIYATPANPDQKGHQVVFQVPGNHSKALVLVVLSVDQKTIEVWHVPTESIDNAAERDSDMKTVAAKLNGRQLAIGRLKIDPVTDFTKALMH